MQVKAVLFSVFRDKLPRENRGRTTLELSEGSSIQDALVALDIQIFAIVSVNGKIEQDFTTILQNGDEIQVFRPIGGGIISVRTLPLFFCDLIKYFISKELPNHD